MRSIPWTDSFESRIGNSIMSQSMYVPSFVFLFPRVRDLLLTGKVVRYGGKRKTKEGTYIDCDIMLFPILDSKESVQGMLLMLTGKESATYVVY